MQTLHISPNKRYLITSDGMPFYLIGDTAWELFHRLSREQTLHYLDTRREQGFNMIQAVMLAELDGLTVPNANGDFPLEQDRDGVYDPTKLCEAYFAHVDYVIAEAQKRALYVGLLPTWGDKWNKLWGAGPEIFTPDNAFLYGKLLAERYHTFDNIIWILGGDRPLTEERHFAIIDAMANGLRAGDGGKFPMTLHPCGAQSSSAFVHDREWLDFNMMQSGHGKPSPYCFDMLMSDYSRTPTKPVMDGEPCYEDHPINFDAGNGYYDAYDVRLAAYRNLFCGACGNTYGHHSIWGFRREDERSAYFPNNWETALHRPGAENIRIYADFITDHPWYTWTPMPELVIDNPHNAAFTAAAVTEDTVYLYLPAGVGVKLDMDKLPFQPTSSILFSPQDGTYDENAVLLSDDGFVTLPGRAAGRYMDAVILLRR